MERPRYIKCPRCELNYIDANKQEYCDVCLKEMHGKHDDFDDFDGDEDEQMEVCPICGENMIGIGETMCEECRKKHSDEIEEEPDPDKDDEWRDYLDDDTDDIEVPEGLPPEDYEDEEDLDDDMSEEENEEDDFDYVTGDEIYTLTGDDFDEDEEDEEDDFDIDVKKSKNTKK